MSALKLDEEELHTIEVIAETEQCGRLTKYEINELTRVYREAASRLQAPAVAEVETPRMDYRDANDLVLMGLARDHADARTAELTAVLRDIAESDDIDNALDPTRNKRLARSALRTGGSE